MHCYHPPQHEPTFAHKRGAEQLPFDDGRPVGHTAGHFGRGEGAPTLARPPGPASCLDRGKELCDVEIEEARLFQVRRVAAAREDN